MHLSKRVAMHGSPNKLTSTLCTVHATECFSYVALEDRRARRGGCGNGSDGLLDDIMFSYSNVRSLNKPQVRTHSKVF